VKDARKAFTAAIKEAAFGDIMQGVDRYAADIERQGTRPEYIAYPATWLRAGRWADEPDAAPTNSTTASFARIGLEFRAAGGVRR
jgi:phage gp37-like protein